NACAGDPGSSVVGIHNGPCSLLRLPIAMGRSVRSRSPVAMIFRPLSPRAAKAGGVSRETALGPSLVPTDHSFDCRGSEAFQARTGAAAGRTERPMPDVTKTGCYTAPLAAFTVLRGSR